MLRIQLSDTDMATVRFDAVPHLDIGTSVQILRGGAPGHLRHWHRQVLPRVPRSAWVLLRSIPPKGPIPAFLTGYDRVSEATASADLVRACAEYDRHCLAPSRRLIQRLVWQELARLRRRRIESGPAAALADLGGGIELRGNVLTVPGHPDREVTVAGRGLQVIPGVFWRRPGFRSDDLPRPALVYPIDPAAMERAAVDSLSRLLGATRAHVLRATATGPSTGRLAGLTGISPASASEHIGVLRSSGLVGTRRHGRSVRHELTGLGAAMVAPD